MFVNFSDKEIALIRLAIPRLAMVAVLLVFSIVVLAVKVRLDSTQQIQMLDINSGDSAAIAAALDGVSLIKAQEIVGYCEMFGSLHSVEKLADVKGIGVATVEKIR